MKSALVTGGAGFIGGHLVDLLMEKGWNVTVIDNFDPFYERKTKESNISSHIQNEAFRKLEIDITNFENLKQSVSGSFDVLVHLAGKAGVRPSIISPQTYQYVNVIGTQNMLELAKQLNIPQFVFASSSSVYGINPNVPWKETDNVLLPISPYASTKVSGELLGHVYSKLYNIRFIALRFFTVYGPRQRPDLAIHKFARSILNGIPITVYGDGSTKRDYTYIDDIVQGIYAAMHYDKLMYDIINLGNDQCISLSDMIASLEIVLGIKSKKQILPPQPGDVTQTWACIDGAREKLSYEPATTFEEGLIEFKEWLTTPNEQLTSDC